MRQLIVLVLLGFIFLGLSCVAKADAEEKKPKVEYIYSMITWYDAIPPYTNEFPHKSESACLAFRARINAILTQYEDDPKFGWIGECTRRES